jgi:hypothetical protein
MRTSSRGEGSDRRFRELFRAGTASACGARDFTPVRYHVAMQNRRRTEWEWNGPSHWLLVLAALSACGTTHDGGSAHESATAAPSTSSTLAPPRAEASRLAADVNWLADDAREGRRAGTEQAKQCAEWIAARMKKLGLEPAGKQGYLQEFTVPLDPRDGGHSMVTGKSVGENPHTLEAKAVPLFCSDEGRVTARLEFGGYGIEDPERKWNDYVGIDVTGAIVFIVRGVPPTKEPVAAAPTADTHVVVQSDGWGGAGSIFSKIMTAKRHGAVGVILAPATIDEPVLRFDAGHGARAGIPAVTISGKEAAQLFSYDSLAEYRNWRMGVIARLDAVTRFPEITVVADVVRGSGPAYNVLGILPGIVSWRAILVGAHYDHLGRGGTGSLAPDKGGEIHHGADDNASGTATVLEMARLMKVEAPPPCDVIFALWSGEELGLLGSEYWGEHPTVPLSEITGNLNLDMVGRAGNGKIQVLGAGTSPDFASWMKDAGEKSGLELIVSTSGNSLGGSSDHQSFLKRGIPALHLFSGLHADYHKPSDTADKFEAGGAAKVAELGVILADDMARETKLAFIAPKIDKEAKGEMKGGFRAWFGSVPSYSYDGQGVLLDGTSNGSPAERAGLIKGDILVQIGEVKIDTIYDMVYALQLYKPGDVVLAKYTRDGTPQEVRVTLSSRELQ